MTEENIRRKEPLTFEQLFNRDLFFFKLMGLSSMNSILSNQKQVKKWWDGIPIFIGIIIMSTIVVLEFQTMCQMFQQQLAYAIQLFSVICSGVLSITKSLRFWMYRMELHDLLQKLGILWKSAQFSCTLTEKISKAAERTKVLTRYYTILVCLLGISYIIQPYTLFIDYHLHKDTNMSFDFSQTVYPCNLPFTIDSFVEYFIWCTFQQCITVAACIPWISCDTLFAQLTTHVSLQFMVQIAFKILANEVTKTIDKCDNLENDHSVSRIVKKIADEYQRLFICCYAIEKFFNPIIFFTVVSNALNLCCCIYRLDQEITAGNWDEVAKNIAHLITLAIQTIIFCSYANTLTETSTKIAEAIYHSRWTDCNRKLKMMLLIIMLRAQKEFKYTAYGIITLNYNQLTNIANASVSYFMLLRNFS